MAVSNQEVAAWLAANPQASDAEIAQAALNAGVSSQQLAQVTGIPVSEVETRIRDVLPSIKPVIEERTVDMGEGTRSEYYVQGTNIAVDAPNYYEDYFSGGPLTESSAPVLQQNNTTIYDAARGGEYVYSPEGQYLGFQEGKRDSGLGGFIKESVVETAPIWSAALTAGGASGALGSTLAPTLSTGAQGAIGGALIGGGTAAVTGNHILKGTLLGGASGYLQGVNAAPAQDSIYSLANGTPNLDYMGGGQGLLSTGSANLASMGGAQGLQILAGLPSTTLAEALNSFAGVNPSVLSDMGLGTGITYVTPSGIVTENGTIIGGDVIGELGNNTGFDLTNWLNENVGAGIGDQLNQIDTGIGGGTPVTGVKTDTTSNSGITTDKVIDALKLGGIVAGLVDAGTDTGQTGFDIVPVPSDWTSPIYGQPTGSAQGLAPIDFGSRELLRGTQWEKYLNPMQPAMAPAPQTGMNYNQLMNTLQGGQGGSLSLNDIISGIQGQYGQTPAGTVG